MADSIESSPANMPAHVASYDRLIAMMKWGGLAVFLIAAFIVWLIA